MRFAAPIALFLALGAPAAAAPGFVGNQNVPAPQLAEPELPRGAAVAVPQPPLTPLATRSGDRSPALAAMIGQMILVGFPGTRPGEEWPSLVAAMIRDSRIGGVVLFAHNIVSPVQVRELNGALRAAGGGLVPFISADQEGGQIQRLPKGKGFVGLPGATVVSAMDGEAAYARYLQSATELAGLGFNVNLGPVVDLNINPSNPAIGALRRSYGRDPGKVTAFARQFVRAHRQAGVLSTAKHFPGHGSAPADPHRQIVDIAGVWQPQELDPFRSLIGDGGIGLVMVGHLIHPRFSDAPDVPASLSARAIRTELRDGLGYRGLVVTDDIEMSAVRRRFGVEEAAVKAVAAGADLIIVANQKNPDPQIVDRIIAAIETAVADGRVPPERVRDAYGRIVAAKHGIAARHAVAMD